MYQYFIIPCLYEAQYVSGDTPPIIRSVKLHWQPLVFHTWEVAGCVVGGQRPPTTHPTTFHAWKTRRCQCSFRLLMMGGLLPETCWASYKYGIIKFWYIVTSCWVFLYEFWVLLWFAKWFSFYIFGKKEIFNMLSFGEIIFSVVSKLRARGFKMPVVWKTWKMLVIVINDTDVPRLVIIKY